MIEIDFQRKPIIAQQVLPGFKSLTCLEKKDRRQTEVFITIVFVHLLFTSLYNLQEL